MSTSPKAVDPSAAADPLAEALDRLERSMSGGTAVPVPQKQGEMPKSLLTEGPRPPVRTAPAATPVPPAPPTDAQRPKISKPSGGNNSVAKPEVTALATSAVEAVASREATLVGEKARAPQPRPAGAGEGRSVVESWSAPVKQQPEATPTVERARKKVPTWEEVTADPPGKPAAPKTRQIPTVQPEPEPRSEAVPPIAPVAPQRIEEIEPEPDPAPRAAPTTRVQGNRRILVQRVGWRRLLLGIALLQAALLAAAVYWVWPVLKRGVIEEASLAAQGGKEVSEILQKRIGESERKVGALGDEVDSLVEKVNLHPGDAWKELDYLGARNQLLEWGDQAIQKADRSALDQLRQAAVDSSDERLRDGARAEVARVVAAYVSGVRNGSYALPVGQLFPAFREKNERELGVDQLIKVMGDASVRAAYRAKAAYLLSDHRGARAAGALADSIATDAHLDVVREACLTFCEMTGYRTTDHLDTESVARWWKVNRVRVKSILGGS